MKKVLALIFLSVGTQYFAQTYYAPTTGMSGTYAGDCPIGTNTGTFVDDGGAGADYSLNIGNIYQTICPTVAGQSVSLTFTSFDMENGYDYISVLNGPAQLSTAFVTAPADAMGIITGTPAVPFTYTATNSSGCLSVRVYSDNMIVAPGFEATISTVNNGTAMAVGNSDCNTSTFICSNTAFNDVSYGPGIVSNEACAGTCLTGEMYSNWYTFTAMTSGTLALTINPVTGTDDFDFALYGPTTACAGGTPIRCSFAGTVGATGLAVGAGDNTEDPSGDGWVEALTVTAGETYQLVVNAWTPGGTGFGMSFGGTATIGTPPPTINSASVCGTQSTTLTATPTKPGGTYSWSPGGETTQSITVSPSVTTTYTCSYTIDGCTSVASGSGTITVTPVPTASISYAGSPFCTSLGAQAVSLSGTNNYTGGTFSSTGGLTINGANGSITPGTSTQGTYTVTYAIPADGPCPSTDVTTSITIDGVPTATAGGSQTICIGETATPPGTAATNGTILWTHNGVGSFTGATTLSPVYTPGVGDAGNTVTLTMTVTSNNSCGGTATATHNVVVNPLPTATVSGTTAVCQGAASPVVTFTGANGTAPYTFYYNINGGATQSVVSAGATATVNASTVTAGTYTYNLLSVDDASATICGQTQTGSAVITVNPLPTATISGTTSVCQGAVSPTVTFTGANGTAPYTFSYNINGGATQTVVSAGANATLSVPTVTAGTYTYNLISVQDASATACSQAQVGSATVTVNLVPTFTVAENDPTTCNGTDGSFIIQGLANNTSYNLTYTNGVTTVGPTALLSDGSGNITVSGLSAGTYDITNFNFGGLCPTTYNGISLLNPGAPVVNDLPNVVLCDATYTLPAITGTNVTVNAAYYTGTGGTGTQYNPGDILDETISPNPLTLYIYDFNGVCSDEQNFTVKINNTPVITNPGAQIACDSYTLPVIAGTDLSGSEAYYNNSQALGGTVIAGPITTSQTVWIYDANGNCSDEESFVVTINNTPVITNPGAQTACDSYSLPAIGGTDLSGSEAYYSNSQAMGGTVITGPITNSQTVWIYDANGTCSDEESFVVTINNTPVITNPGAQSACDSYSLPVITGTNLTGSQAFYNNSQAMGGTVISGSISSSQTVWIYDANGSCTDEESYVVTVNTTPALTITDPSPVCAPQTVDLSSPAITAGSTNAANLSYWTDAMATISLANADAVSSSGIYYIKADNSGCTDIKPVLVTVNQNPDIDDITDVETCGTYTLPVITGTNLTGNEAYYLGPNGSLNQYQAGDIYNIVGTISLYIYDEITGCSDEESFSITVNPNDVAAYSLTDFCQGGWNQANITGDAGIFEFEPSVSDGATIDATTGAISNGVGGTTYTVQFYTQGQCPDTLVQTVSVIALPTAPVIGGEATYCISDQPLPLDATGSVGCTIEWFSDASLTNSLGTGTTITPLNTTQYYYVIQTDNTTSCQSPISVGLISFTSCPIEIPSAFTPDGDLTNDTWDLDYLDVNYPQSTVKIYNRWGNVVFESEAGKYEQYPWDGKINGDELPVASYYYSIEYNDGVTDASKGTVTIIRKK